MSCIYLGFAPRHRGFYRISFSQFLLLFLLGNGGGWYLLSVQALCCVCLATWGICSCMILLWLINKVVLIRMAVHVELLGADLTEHRVRHGQVGVSRAISAWRPYIDTSALEDLINVGLNPAHSFNINIMKSLQKKRKYKLSKILMDMTRKRNFGINRPWKLFPTIGKKNEKKSKTEKIFKQTNKFILHLNVPKKDEVMKNHLPWVE